MWKKELKSSNTRSDSDEVICECRSLLISVLAQTVKRNRAECYTDKKSEASAPKDKQMSKDDIQRRWIGGAICIYLLRCYTKCHTGSTNPVYFKRQVVRQDEYEALYACFWERQVIWCVFMRGRGVSDIGVTYSWAPRWNLGYLSFLFS